LSTNIISSYAREWLAGLSVYCDSKKENLQQLERSSKWQKKNKIGLTVDEIVKELINPLPR
jgi:hypothetical protein